MGNDSEVWPEFELVNDLMSALVTCNFDEDLIKILLGIIVSTTYFFQYKSMEIVSALNRE